MTTGREFVSWREFVGGAETGEPCEAERRHFEYEGLRSVHVNETYIVSKET